MANISQFVKAFIASIKPVATTGNYSDLTGVPTLGTAAALDVGTDANKIMQLDSNGKIPAFDGSNLTGLPTSLDYIGDIKQSSQSSNHGKWLLCNGSAVSRTAYSALFAVIGTSFGNGDGSTTFTLPDARGRILGTIGQGSGLTSRALGASVGAETHTLSTGEIPSHSHNLFGGNSAGTPPARSSIVCFSGTNDLQIRIGSYNTNNLSSAVDSTGGGLPHINMQPTLFVGNVFIYAGV